MTVLVYATLIIALASLVFDVVATRWHLQDRKHLHGGGHAHHVAEIVVGKLTDKQNMDVFLREHYPAELVVTQNGELNE